MRMLSGAVLVLASSVFYIGSNAAREMEDAGDQDLHACGPRLAGRRRRIALAGVNVHGVTWELTVSDTAAVRTGERDRPPPPDGGPTPLDRVNGESLSGLQPAIVADLNDFVLPLRIISLPRP
jgi:hypothetical protein